jgi:hypothetical protein
MEDRASNPWLVFLNKGLQEKEHKSEKKRHSDIISNIKTEAWMYHIENKTCLNKHIRAKTALKTEKPTIFIFKRSSLSTNYHGERSGGPSPS